MGTIRYINTHGMLDTLKGHMVVFQRVYSNLNTCEKPLTRFFHQPVRRSFPRPVFASRGHIRLDF